MPTTKDKTMTTKNELHLLAASLKVGFFATREGISDALEYAAAVAKASDNPPAVLTALHVALNTVAARINEIADQLPTEPEPLTDDERDAYLHAAHLMYRNGGGFASALADAYMKADSINSQILRTSFAHIFNRYMEQTA
jgi:hypothetical protein